MTLCAFGNIYFNDFVLDDIDFIVNWPLIRDLRNIPKFFIGYTPPVGQEGVYSPLKTLIHAINYNLFKENPFGYHVIAIAIHLLGTVFAYKIISLLTKNNLVSFLSALFFGLHPVHAGVITNLTGSVDAAGMAFMFIAFYYYMQTSADTSAFKEKSYWKSIVFAFLAVYTHELVITLPLVIFWYDLCFKRYRKSVTECAIRVAPFFLIVGTYVIAKFLNFGTILRGGYLYDNFILTQLVIIKALWKYVMICFFPFKLTHNHVISPGIYSFSFDDFDKASVLSQSFFEWKVILSICLLIGLLYWAIKSWKKNPLITFSIGWFYICLLPVLQLVPSAVLFAERYLYPGSMTFCLLLALCLSKGLEQANKSIKTLSVLFFIFCVIFYSGRTWMRSADFKDEITLFETVVKANPKSALMRTDLGVVYTRFEQNQKALNSFHEALKIRQDDADIYFLMSEPYIQLNDHDKAREALLKAIELNPDYADAYYNLAGLYAMSEEEDKAMAAINTSMNLYHTQGRDQEATEYLAVFLNYFYPELNKELMEGLIQEMIEKQ